MRRSLTWPHQAGSTRLSLIVAHASIARTIPHFSAFFILTTLLLRIVAVERPYRPADASARAAVAGAGFHGKTSVGVARRDS
ncbi:hypothetical protein [Burkholderia sp. Ac-20344]|uniref:hypothetical protein n=1 Tax=Burkholderia sp. Ac-20344 TaxID=2703890 RepID=UPI00197C1E94|nr:hypothetical protein [Burkholderia sp. Ac-20344]MBN3832817.1 hypothetical protein [Burkholderia sp. Ac-20344]